MARFDDIALDFQHIYTPCQFHYIQTHNIAYFFLALAESDVTENLSFLIGQRFFRLLFCFLLRFAVKLIESVDDILCISHRNSLIFRDERLASFREIGKSENVPPQLTRKTRRDERAAFDLCFNDKRTA